MTSQPDRDKRAANRAHWAARGAAWTRSAPESRTSSEGQDQALIEAARISPGDTVLDLASGTGEPAISLARHVGPDGLVLATDLTPEMLVGARRLAADDGLANIRFAIAEMESLPFADARFDAVTCRFGLMFPPDPVLAAGEARRMLKPGRKAAFMVWGPMEGNDAFHIVRRTVYEFFGEEPPSPVMRHRYGAPGSVAEVISAAGFADVAERDLIESSEFSAGKPFWETRLQRNFAQRIAGLDTDGRVRLDDAIVAAFAPCLRGDIYRLQTHAIMCVGTAPA